MGKINLNAMKQQRKEQEVETPVPEALEQSYASVWGKDKETVEYIELGRIIPFTDAKGRTQPFKVTDDKVQQIKLSAADIGIVTPLIVRKLGNEYQIISGHHRYVAAQQLEMLTVPCVIRDISDDEAVKYVAECNIQRSKLLPTEYAEIYARYMEMRQDIDMTAQEIADKFAISKKSLYRYIKILDLSDEMKKLIDEDMLHTDTAEIFCAFTEEQQGYVCEFVEKTGKKINRALAKAMESILQEGDVTGYEDFLPALEKPTKAVKNKLYNSFAEKYSVSYSEEEWDSLVTELLTKHFESNN